MKSQEHINTAQNTMAANTLLPHTLRFIVNEVLHRCLAMSSPYWKYLRPATRKNFSKKTSESRTAMWAARPIREFAVLGNAWITSYRTRLQSLFCRTGKRMFWIISAYTGPDCLSLRAVLHISIRAEW